MSEVKKHFIEEVEIWETMKDGMFAGIESRLEARVH
jgi:hypothetical protein